MLERAERKRIKHQGLKSTKLSKVFQEVWKERTFKGREHG